jgi:hypothetical protein
MRYLYRYSHLLPYLRSMYIPATSQESLHSFVPEINWLAPSAFGIDVTQYHIHNHTVILHGAVYLHRLTGALSTSMYFLKYHKTLI